VHLVAYQMLDTESSVQSAGSGCAGEATAAVSVMAMRGILIGLFPPPKAGGAAKGCQRDQAWTQRELTCCIGCNCEISDDTSR
jgi:hypothetical protein